MFLEAGSFSSEPVTRTLSVTTSGDGDGVVSSSDEGINCDSTIGDPELTDCSEVYDEGTSVTLTATPNEGSDFVQWTGCDSTEGNTCSLTMNDERTVDAQFGLHQSEETADLCRSSEDRIPRPGSGPIPCRAVASSLTRCPLATVELDAATGVTVVDTATNGTVQSGSGTNWTCGEPSGQTPFLRVPTDPRSSQEQEPQNRSACWCGPRRTRERRT